MITLFEGAVPDSATGCRMQALRSSYRDIENAVSFYRGSGDMLLCRFGETLLASGDGDLEELGHFADALGISRIELEAGGAPRLRGWKAERCPILYRDCSGGEEIPFLPSLKRCFEVICAADSGFARKAEYLYWLSDITRRQNRGCAKAYLLDGAAAVVSAVGEGTAYLSSVAVPPELRGEGRASRLLEALLSDRLLCGKRLFTAARHEGLAGFYEKPGFLRLGNAITIFEKERL